MEQTKNHIIACLFVFAFAFFGLDKASATVAVTAATGGGSISADTAANAKSPGWTTLGRITITEGASSDFNTANNQTMTLKAPAGFQFNTAQPPSVSYTAGRDISAATAAYTDSSTLVITFSVSGVAQSDTLTIGSTTAIQVRPTVGTPLATGNHIYCSAQSQATAGITTSTDGSSGSNFGALTELVGTATAIQFVQGPPASVTAGATLSPAVTVKTTDQFANPVSGLSVTMSLNGSGTLTGGGAQSTASGTGIATFSGLSINQTGSKTLTANVSSPALSVTSSSFSVTPGAIAHYLVSATTTQTRGTAFGVTVTAQDANNNAVTTDNSTVVTLTGSTANVLFDGSGDNSFRHNTVALSGGTFTVNTMDNLGESVTITAKDANAKNGTSSSITVNGLSGDYRSNVSPNGNWDDVGSWQTWNGSSWVAAASAPTGAAGVNIAILSGGTITLRAAATLLGTLTVNGALSFSGSGVLTVGSGGCLQSAGTVNGSTSTLIFNSGGIYQHNFTTTAGTIPTATWNTGSTCAIIGYTSTAGPPGGVGQSFYNFTWNCPNQGSDASVGDNLTTVNGDLSVASTGVAQLRLKSSDGNSTTTVSGNYKQSGGMLAVKSGGVGTGTLTVKGFSLTGGTFNMTGYGISVLNVGGDFSVTGAGVFTRTYSSTATVNFNGSHPQNFTKSGSMGDTINYTVSSGSVLLMGASSLTGAGTFNLNSGAGLGIGDPNGITSGTTASGNIQVTGTRTFNAGASYIYNGAATQVTGSGLPATLTGNVTNANSAGLSLTASETINAPGIFVVNSGGVLTMGTTTISGLGTFALASGGTLQIGDANGITSSGATGNIRTTTRNFSNGGNYSYNGTGPQAAGDGLPTTINSLSVNNTAGAVTLSRVTTVTTSVTLASGANLSLPSGTSTAATLVIAGVKEAAGTWGNTGTGAANIDSAHFAGTGVLNVTTGPATSTALASSPNPSSYGSPVTFTATVTGSGPAPTGTVTFKEGSTTLGSGTLNGSGVATFVMSTLAVAGSPHSIIAVYGGDGNYGGSSSSAVAQTVNKANPSVAAWPTATDITYGQTLADSTLTGGSATPGGAFAFTAPSMAPNAGTASQSVTYTPTDTANYNNASGTVTLRVLPRLSGSLANACLSGYKGDTIKVLFVAKDSHGKALATNAVQLATADGGSSFTYAIGVPPDTATLSLKPAFYLRRKFAVPPNIATGNQVTLDITGTFLGGDADGNNQVDGNDYAWIRALWGKTSNTQYDINGDGKVDADDFPNLNGDGVIDALDYAVLKAGWYQKGDDE